MLPPSISELNRLSFIKSRSVLVICMFRFSSCGPCPLTLFTGEVNDLSKMWHEVGVLSAYKFFLHLLKSK